VLQDVNGKLLRLARNGIPERIGLPPVLLRGVEVIGEVDQWLCQRTVGKLLRLIRNGIPERIGILTKLLRGI